MNFDQTLERMQKVCGISACVAIVGLCAVLASPAPPKSALEARQSGNCIVLVGSGIANGFAVCGDPEPVSEH